MTELMGAERGALKKAGSRCCRDGLAEVESGQQPVFKITDAFVYSTSLATRFDKAADHLTQDRLVEMMALAQFFYSSYLPTLQGLLLTPSTLRGYRVLAIYVCLDDG